jgi:glucosamine 6-phosphate synthetase-like amidotransferase/phosphosugar isomerase protein
MCGIAGFSVANVAGFDGTAVARLLVAGIAERGRDATGFAYHGPDGRVHVVKDSIPLAEFIGRVELPAHASEAIMHVRDYTKGVPGLNDNNHPIRYGRVVGVHNGHLSNDDELFERWNRPRSTPTISVDSEAIMMLVDTLGDASAALEHVRGSAAIAALHDGETGRLTLARRASRPLVVARGEGILLFASTREPLDLAARALRRHLHVEEIGEGRALEVRGGEVVARSRFRVDRRHVGATHVDYGPAPDKRALVRHALAGFA